MGEQFTAADVVIGSGLRWGMMFKMIPERKEFTWIMPRASQRPGAKRAEAKDKDAERGGDVGMTASRLPLPG